MPVRDVVLWPVRQLAAVPGRFRSQAGGIRAREWIRFYFVKPIINTWIVVKLIGGWMLGFGTPVQQILGSIISAFAVLVGSLGVLAPIVPVFILPWTIGVLRLLPAVDRQWQRLTGTGDSAFRGDLDSEVSYFG